MARVNINVDTCMDLQICMLGEVGAQFCAYMEMPVQICMHGDATPGLHAFSCLY